jgi:hypothetical protein
LIKKVGEITEQVISVLGLDVKAGSAILIGETNVRHIKSKHSRDYEKYGKRIKDILLSPDYVGINPKDASIEYIKEFEINGAYVKVAVRVSSRGTHFVRSMYAVNANRVKNFAAKGMVKSLTK